MKAFLLFSLINVLFSLLYLLALGWQTVKRITGYFKASY